MQLGNSGEYIFVVHPSKEKREQWIGVTNGKNLSELGGQTTADHYVFRTNCVQFYVDSVC